MRTSSLAILSASISFAFACTPQPTGPTWHTDVAPIIQGRCASCHVEGGIGPFPLTTYDEARLTAARIKTEVQSGTMPPWKAAKGDVSFLRNPSLSDEQKATLAAWADTGAAEGDPKKAGTPLAPLAGKLEHVDETLTMPEPYTPQLLPDDYRCFVLKWNKTTPTYVTGVNGVPGVPAQVHHVAMYLVPPDKAELPVQWDADEALPGYTCFGGPFGDRDQSFPVGLLTAWIPGYQGSTFPRGGGILIPPGSTIVMQVHYNIHEHSHDGGIGDMHSDAEPDQTAMQFQLSPTVQKPFAYQPLLDAAWVLGGMRIPAGESSVTHEFTADPRAFFRTMGTPLTLTTGFNIEAVMFHMHNLGRKGTLVLEKADGRQIRVLQINDWDFHWQFEYQLETPMRFEPGDKLRVTCTFDNSTGTKDVNWGEGSDDEMCVANILSSE